MTHMWHAVWWDGFSNRVVDVTEARVSSWNMNLEHFVRVADTWGIEIGEVVIARRPEEGPKIKEGDTIEGMPSCERAFTDEGIRAVCRNGGAWTGAGAWEIWVRSHWSGQDKSLEARGAKRAEAIAKQGLTEELLEGGRAYEVEEILSEVWGSEQPESARHRDRRRVQPTVAGQFAGDGAGVHSSLMGKRGATGGSVVSYVATVGCRRRIGSRVVGKVGQSNDKVGMAGQKGVGEGRSQQMVTNSKPKVDEDSQPTND